MRQIRISKRRTHSAGRRQEPLRPDPRDPDIVKAHEITPSRPGDAHQECDKQEEHHHDDHRPYRSRGGTRQAAQAHRRTIAGRPGGDPPDSSTASQPAGPGAV